MKQKNHRRRFITPCVALVALLLPGRAALADDAKRLVPRPPAAPAEVYALPDTTPVERVVVKFDEGTGVRLQDGVLAGGAEAAVEADAAEVQALLLADPRVAGLARLFEADEQSLLEQKRRGEARSGRELADLNLYFEVKLARAFTFDEVQPLLALLNGIPGVEIAYAQPKVRPATVAGGAGEEDLVPTPSFRALQQHLGSAPVGVDAKYSWTILGGSGRGVKVVDVEYAWQTSHEDLPALVHRGGTPSANKGFRNHGTAVLGALVARPNGFGVHGVSFKAEAGIESVLGRPPAAVINTAATVAGPGNVVLVPLQGLGPSDGTACACNTLQCNYLPLEFWQAEFDAIATATANGVVVIEAAGNGSVDLDAAAYARLFERGFRDSGAILVGASLATRRAPTCWSNFGQRVDGHAWGQKVVTTGFGDLFAGAEDRWYTSLFGGTSSATPIVAGVVANLQGVRRAHGLDPLDPLALRDLLRQSGTPQVAGLPRAIGPQPNLRKAIELALEEHPEAGR